MSTDCGNNKTNTGTSSPQQNAIIPFDASAADFAYNPTLAESEYPENELELLKGDAIGETLYSERFVLKTLLKLGELTADLQEDEDFERDLCFLWDMTLEEDVVKYLLKQEVIDLFGIVIKNTEDIRLTEILVGMLGNMCNIQQSRDVLTDKPEVLEILVELTACMDALMLEQLMRLLTVVFAKMPEDHIEKWYTVILKSEKFVGNICFILSNAANNPLILQTLESLNAILAKFFVLKLSLAVENEESVGNNRITGFEQLFVCPEVIKSTIEAFNTLVIQDCNDQDNFDASEKWQITYKAKRTFCNIHSILTQYQELSKQAYNSSNNEILNCFKEILEPMVEQNSVSTWQQHDQDVLETLNDVLKILPRPVECQILNCLLKLLHTVDLEQAKHIQNSTEFNDFESAEDDDIDHKISYTLILDSLYFLVSKASKDELKQYIFKRPRIYVDKLLQTFDEPHKSEFLYPKAYLLRCYLRLTEAILQ